MMKEQTKTHVIPELNGQVVDEAMVLFQPFLRMLQREGKLRDNPLAITVLLSDATQEQGCQPDLLKFESECQLTTLRLTDQKGNDPENAAQNRYKPNALRKARAVLRTGKDGAWVLETPEIDDFIYYGAVRIVLPDGKVLIVAISGLKENEDFGMSLTFAGMISMILLKNYEPLNRPEGNDSGVIIKT